MCLNVYNLPLDGCHLKKTKQNKTAFVSRDFKREDVSPS